MLGAVTYTNAVDLWSVGCVLAELTVGTPLFQANNSVEQLAKVVIALGAPTAEEMYAMNNKFENYEFPVLERRTIKGFFDKIVKELREGTKNTRYPPREINICPHFYNFLDCFIQYDPKKRISPGDALLHPYFDEVRHASHVNGIL